jgi:hypothetical protein
MNDMGYKVSAKFGDDVRNVDRITTTGNQKESIF